MHQQRNEQIADNNTRGCAHGRQQRALAEQQTQHLSARSPQGQTHGDVIGVGRVARQDNGGQVGAEQNFKDNGRRAQQHPARPVPVAQHRVAPLLAFQLNAEAEVLCEAVARRLPVRWKPTCPIPRDGLLPNRKRGCFRRRARHPGLQSRHDREPVRGGPAVLRKHQPKGVRRCENVGSGVGGESVERARHDAHDHKRVVVEDDGLADNARVAMEPGVPEGVTQHSGRSARGVAVVTRLEHSSIERGHAEQGEELRRYKRDVDLLSRGWLTEDGLEFRFSRDR